MGILCWKFDEISQTVVCGFADMQIEGVDAVVEGGSILDGGWTD